MNTIFAEDSQVMPGWVNVYDEHEFGDIVHVDRKTADDAARLCSPFSEVKYRIRIRPWIRWDGKDHRGPDLPEGTLVRVKLSGCPKTIIPRAVKHWAHENARQSNWFFCGCSGDIVAYQIAS